MLSKVGNCNVVTRFMRYASQAYNCPSMGDSINEGSIEEWKVKEGQYVNEGDVLASVETDKITIDIASEFSGVITKLLVDAADTAIVGEPLLEFDPELKEGELIVDETSSKTTQKLAEDPAGLNRKIEIKPMSRMRQTVAKRLKESQNNAASLTTFNEIDMTNLMASRKANASKFMEEHDIKLGINGYFLKASQLALKKFPEINSYIDESGKNILVPEFIDINVAVATPTGLMTPAIRNCQNFELHEFESELQDLATRGREGDITMDDMAGGNFTISNGGVFGSLMGTPILNPPQSAILGLHGTQMRPKVMDDGSIVARPMMYVALTYDHRMVDGREAVLFLKELKNIIESPDFKIV